MRKFITFSVVFFLVILIGGTTAFLLSMRQIIRENKGNVLAQILEIERIKLETSVNNEIVIALKMADSPLIQQYFSNPSDVEVRNMAVVELASYSNAFASNIAFWINDIDKMFYYTGSEPYFLDPESPENYWYPMTLYETDVYNFNINYNPDVNTTNLWINAPVYDVNRNAVGMVGTGIDISTYLEIINTDHAGRLDVYFFNTAGEITGAKDVDLVAGKVNVEEELGIAIMAIAEDLHSGEIKILDTPVGRISIGSVPLLEWYSIAIMPDSYRDYFTLLTALFVLMLIVVMVTIIIFNFFIASLLKPLQRSMIAAETANHAKSVFLANMSHEIRTPMNSIMGFAELAMDKVIEPAVKDYLSKIKDSTRWLLHIINDILDISKIESGNMELEHVPFDLHEIILRCQSVILPGVKEKGLDLRVYAEQVPGKKLLGDSVRLYQALMNLLSNAIKFTETGIVRLSSSVKSSDNGSAVVYFEVRDSGIGMNQEQIKKIFMPFMQADSSTTRNYGGTGLGLAITKNIVELMGGSLNAESSPGGGSTFSFEITFDTIETSEAVNEAAKYDVLEKPLFEGLILICDDNPMNRQVICEHLASVGLKTVAAENGKVALEIVLERMQMGEKPFDLIFMDIFMPVMDGIEAATAITALNTGTPIIAMTANVMINELEKYKSNGMPDFLSKPFTTQELWRILMKYLTPVSTMVIDEHQQEIDKNLLNKKLQINFVKSNQDLYTKIIGAISANDIQLAHRLVHTLKGEAGMLGKTLLQNTAAEIEDILLGGSLVIPDDKMNLLKNELASVLEKLKPLLDEPEKKHESLTAEETLALINKLEPMLENINPECVNLLDEILAIPGTEELARQIEQYDFDAAIETLTGLKQNMFKEPE